MDFVMSKEYAALAVSVDAALLVVGTVQSHTLAKSATATFVRLQKRRETAMRALSNRLQAGEEPTAEELAQADRHSRPSFLPAASVGLLGSLWGVLSMALVTGLVGSVFWTATENPGPAPWLANFTAWATFVSANFLVLEAAVQFAGAVRAIPEADVARSNIGADLYDQATQRLNEYRHARRRPEPDPDPAQTP